MSYIPYRTYYAFSVVWIEPQREKSRNAALRGVEEVQAYIKARLFSRGVSLIRLHVRNHPSLNLKTSLYSIAPRLSLNRGHGWAQVHQEE